MLPSVEDCRKWIVATIWPHVWFGAALALVALLAYQRHLAFAVLAGLVLLAAAIYLDHRIKVERTNGAYKAAEAHVAIAVLQVLIGAAVVAWSRSRDSDLSDLAGFIALGIIFVGAGSLISELR